MTDYDGPWCSECELNRPIIAGLCRACYRNSDDKPVVESSVLRHSDGVVHFGSSILIPPENDPVIEVKVDLQPRSVPKISKPPTVRTVSERIEERDPKHHSFPPEKPKKPRQKGAVEIKLEKKESCWFCSPTNKKLFVDYDKDTDGPLCRHCKDQLNGFHDYLKKRGLGANSPDNGLRGE